MSEYIIKYAYCTLNDHGGVTNRNSTQHTVKATSDAAAMEIIKSKHPGKHIEYRSIEKKSK